MTDQSEYRKSKTMNKETETSYRTDLKVNPNKREPVENKTY